MFSVTPPSALRNLQQQHLVLLEEERRIAQITQSLLREDGRSAMSDHIIGKIGWTYLQTLGMDKKTSAPVILEALNTRSQRVSLQKNSIVQQIYFLTKQQILNHPTPSLSEWELQRIFISPRYPDISIPLPRSSPNDALFAQLAAEHSSLAMQLSDNFKRGNFWMNDMISEFMFWISQMQQAICNSHVLAYTEAWQGYSIARDHFMKERSQSCNSPEIFVNHYVADCCAPSFGMPPHCVQMSAHRVRLLTPWIALQSALANQLMMSSQSNDHQMIQITVILIFWISQLQKAICEENRQAYSNACPHYDVAQQNYDKEKQIRPAPKNPESS